MPRFSIPLVAMVNGTDSLIPFSDFSLLLFRNARDFCVLILSVKSKRHKESHTG